MHYASHSQLPPYSSGKFSFGTPDNNSWCELSFVMKTLLKVACEICGLTCVSKMSWKNIGVLRMKQRWRSSG